MKIFNIAWYQRRFKLLIVLGGLFLVTQVAQANSPRRGPTPLDINNRAVLVADPEYSSARVLAPPFNRQIQTSTFIVNYNGPSCSGLAWSSEAQAAFQRAVDIWASLIISPVPIEVDACWESLETGVLGAAGPADYYRDTSLRTWYPIALANKIYDTDLSPNIPDIEAFFNRNFSNWYFGLDGNPPANQYDFVSVVLHELGHGLGFSGAFGYNTDADSRCGGIKGYGCLLNFGGIPDIYDRFTEDVGGRALLDYSSPSSSLGNTLTGGIVYFNGPNTNAGNGGSPAKLYAPSSWSQGSSYSHLDEIYNDTPHALMTYSLARGESAHNPGDVALGMLLDMGWEFTTTPDLNLTKSASTSVTAGEKLLYTLTINNAGNGQATGIVLIDNLSASVAVDANSLPAEATLNGQTITWNIVEPLPPEQSLTRQVEVTVLETASGSITNNATVISNEGSSATASASTTVLTPPKLSVQKSINISRSPVERGDSIIYTLVLANSGQTEAQNVNLIDTLPDYVVGNSLNKTLTIPPNGQIVEQIIALLADDAPPITITNVAKFSYQNQQGEDSVAFTVAPWPFPCFEF